MPPDYPKASPRNERTCERIVKWIMILNTLTPVFFFTAPIARPTVQTHTGKKTSYFQIPLAFIRKVSDRVFP